MYEEFQNKWLEIPFTREDLITKKEKCDALITECYLGRKPSPESNVQIFASSVASLQWHSALNAIFGKYRELTLKILWQRGYIFPAGVTFLEDDAVREYIECTIMNTVTDKARRLDAYQRTVEDIFGKICDWMTENLPECA